mmetsp:Transcript_39732/g.93054  ORF Transcript_39732/g.93054 Transcript_39732/m.93054 type:complete len:81 (+) Transcript_39732:72-314(+)
MLHEKEYSGMHWHQSLATTSHPYECLAWLDQHRSHFQNICPSLSEKSRNEGRGKNGRVMWSAELENIRTSPDLICVRPAC